MTLPLVLGGLMVAAVILAAAKHIAAARSNNGPIELGVKQPSKPLGGAGAGQA